MPDVSVGMPVFNGARYLRAALDALLAQDHESFEIFISDNGSTDDTPRIAEEYSTRDNRVHWERQSVNRGAAWNFNHVVHEARGRYFMWAAHDDLWRSDCISLYVAALDTNPDVVLVSGRPQPVGSDAKPIGAPYHGFANAADDRRARFRRVLEYWQTHYAIYGMYRTEIIRKTRLISTRVACEPIFMSELALYGKTMELPEVCSMLRVPDPGVNYRSTDEQLSYLDPRAVAGKATRFVGLWVTLESLRGIPRAGISPSAAVPLVTDAVSAYVRSRALLDLKEEVTLRLGPSYPNLLQSLRQAYRRLIVSS